MTSQPPVDQTQAERPYVFFLFKQIDRIYDAWDEDDYEHALKRALRLVVGLPSDIKDALEEQKQEIRKEMSQAYGLTDVDFYMTCIIRNRATDRVAQRHLEPLMDKMIRLLDNKKWLEKGALRARFPEKKKLKVTT